MADFWPDKRRNHRGSRKNSLSVPETWRDMCDCGHQRAAHHPIQPIGKRLFWGPCAVCLGDCGRFSTERKS